MPKLDYDAALKRLEENFAEVESKYIEGIFPAVDQGIYEIFNLLFSSKTQAYREVLLGCILVKLQDKTFNIHLPYINQGPRAYNGRTLDERVINPFLRSKKTPCSKGPFLSVFRRSVKFDNTTREGVRDKAGFDSLIRVINTLEESKKEEVLAIFKYTLYRFIRLREESTIEILKFKRISLEQCDSLISKLLNIQSGGRFPLYLIVAAFKAIKEVFELDWDIEFQDINVADFPSGAGGDVTLKQNGDIVLAAEITERPVEKSRVISIFDTKIAPNAIEDYLFFIKDYTQAKEALDQARRYFSQGHEVNFMEIKNWIVVMLSVLGKRGRDIFMKEMVSFLDDVDIPKALKIAWNEIITSIASGKS